MDIRDKTLIFTITSGRSGSGYLANVLYELDGVYACHESRPVLDKIYQTVRKENPPSPTARGWWLNHKLPAIAKTPGHVYIETSHLFCKGFMEPFVKIAEEWGINYKFILLTRYNIHVANSMYSLNTIPGKTSKGSYWYIVPGEKISYTTLPGWGNLHDYQLCFWYTLEIMARANHALVMYPDKCASVDLHDFRRRDKVEEFLRNLGLLHAAGDSFWRFWETSIGRRVNNKDGSKNGREISGDYRDRLIYDVYNRITYRKKIENQETEVLSHENR